MTNLQLAIQLFLQLAIILMVCRVVGMIAARFGQPQVVAEMIAGVCLGPSLMGLFLPDVSKALFPPDSMKVLFPLSQLGLALYMFIVGLEFRMDIVKKRFGSSMAVSFAGMVAPFILGAAVGWYFFNHTTLFPKATSQTNAMIFMGASMCITAFPMLARIIHFKGLAGTTMGTVAIGAGAIDDAAAWGMLALVLASFNGDMSHAVLSIGGGIGYVLIAQMIIRPILERYAKGIEARGKVSDGEYAFFLSLMCLGAWWTDYIELHAVFGAFIMGSAMPRGIVSRTIIERTQPLAVALILPLFFTFSG
ncbi:MAG: cation:proton antiporter, partial [Verrucomicrobia bacterium]|nr:cation:proton antiporter [Verrucomicrobiota bacterium]